MLWEIILLAVIWITVLGVYTFIVTRERFSYLAFLLVGFAALLVGTRLSVYAPNFLSPSGGGTDLITSLLTWLPLLLVVLYGVRRSLRDVGLAVGLAAPLVLLTYYPVFVLGIEHFPVSIRFLPYFQAIIPIAFLVSSMKFGYAARATAISYAAVTLAFFLYLLLGGMGL
ncbi:MAG: hypothetical protein R6U44_10110 [Archaeoglobaceae archaeon]